MSAAYDSDTFDPATAPRIASSHMDKGMLWLLFATICDAVSVYAVASTINPAWAAMALLEMGAALIVLSWWMNSSTKLTLHNFPKVRKYFIVGAGLTLAMTAACLMSALQLMTRGTWFIPLISAIPSGWAAFKSIRQLQCFVDIAYDVKLYLRRQ